MELIGTIFEDDLTKNHIKYSVILDEPKINSFGLCTNFE